MKGAAFHERYFDAIITSLKHNIDQSGDSDFDEAQNQVVQAMYFFVIDHDKVEKLVELMFEYYQIYKADMAQYK